MRAIVFVLSSIRLQKFDFPRARVALIFATPENFDHPSFNRRDWRLISVSLLIRVWRLLRPDF